MKEVFERGMKYSFNFFYGSLDKVEKVYEIMEGLFVIGKNGEENVLFWGVDKLKDLENGLRVIKKENDKFRFTYAGNLNDVIEKTRIISNWGYHVKNTHIGYFLDMKNIDISIENENRIEELYHGDIEKFLELERSVFDSFNVSEEEITDWVKDDDYIILVSRINSEIKGFTIMNVYGDKKEWCFIRNLGVAKDQRRKGIGKVLMYKALQMAKERGVEKSMLWVGLQNNGARSLYEKIGYELNENEVESVFYHIG